MYCRHTPAFFIVITMNQIRWTSNRPWKRHFTGICGAILELCFEENTQIGAAFYIGSLGCCTMSPCMSLHTRRMRRSISQTERLFHRGSHLLSGCWLTEDLFIANFLFKLLGGFRVQGLGFRDVLSSNFFLESVRLVTAGAYRMLAWQVAHLRCCLPQMTKPLGAVEGRSTQSLRSTWPLRGRPVILDFRIALLNLLDVI